MAHYGNCPRGGIPGLLVSATDFQSKPNHVFVIPLRRKKKRCTNSEHARTRMMEYWENEKTGSHGWACSKCGEVIQWG
jgi:hypothetical protein